MTVNPKVVLLSLLLTPLFSAGSAAADEDAAVFSGLSYPITAPLRAAQKEGAVLFETPFSAAPAAEYDTILIQGELAAPGVTVEAVIKSGSFFLAPASYLSEQFRRFPSGRFWARFSVPLTRQPLKFRVVSLGLKTNSSITIYETGLFQAGKAAEAAVPQSTVPYVPDAALFLPESAPFKVIRRAEWRAAPPTQPYTPHAPRYFTLHHTQAHYPKNYAEAVNEMLFIQDYHQHGRGWIDIAYHFLIDPAGNIFEGRPINVLGAHVLSRNTGNIGISIMGNYHPPANDPFTAAAQDSFVAVGRYLKDTYEVPVSSFYAHRDIGNSDCPGDNLYAKKPLLTGLIFTPPAPALPPPPGDVPPLTEPQQRSLRQLMLSPGAL